MCSDAPSYRKEAMREFGKRLGILYQMVDDYCDGDAPVWLIENFEDEVREQYNLALRQLRSIPESEYKEALQDVVGFMLTKLAAEGGNEVRRIVKDII